MAVFHHLVRLYCFVVLPEWFAYLFLFYAIYFFFLPLPEKVSFETCGLHSMMKCLQKTVQVMNGLKENGSDKVPRITPVYPDITHNSLCCQLCGKRGGAAISFHL